MFFHLTIFLAGLALTVAKPPGYIHRGMELPEGYTESEITWTGLEHLLDDSEGVNASAIKAVAGLSLKGPIQSVMAQLESMGHSVLKPNLNDTEFESKMDEILAEDREDNTQALRFHECGVGGDGYARTNFIEDGADYIHELPDSVRCSNIPYTCGRISCSYSAAIWWCNDRDVSIDFACNYFAKYAYEVIRDCQEGYKVRGLAGNSMIMFRVVLGHSPEKC